MKSTTQDTKFLRVKDLTDITSLSVSSIWDRVDKGTFPKPIKLSARVTVWTMEQVQTWMAEQIAMAS